MISNKTPEFNGSMAYIERCNSLMECYHKAMMSKNYNLSIDILQALQSELYPWLGEDMEKCSEYENKALEERKIMLDKRLKKRPINTNHIHNWYRKLNIAFHERGLGMRSKKKEEFVEL